jgi:membrane protein implicated in regulation of membrane protease activity
MIVNMPLLEKIFFTSALCGTVVFFMRMLLMFIGLTGGHGDSDGFLHHDGSHDAAIADNIDHVDSLDSHDLDSSHSDIHDQHDHDNSDASFKFLSLQGLTAFFMMFGWVGFAMIRDSKLPGWAAIIGGLLAGIATVYVLAFIFKIVLNLQSDGTMRISSALGSGGSVYLRIPADGSGQVQVEVDGRLQIFDAVSAKKEEIKTGDQITVVWVQDNGVLVVEKDERDQGGKLCGQ